MTSGKRIAVAMSGGVDSTLAAALLIEQGFDVFGLTMDLSSVRRDLYAEPREGAGTPPENGERGKDVEDAADAARLLNIPHRVVDISREFRKRVIDYFVSEYRQGRTPNPCIRCNETIKFSLLLETALEGGAEGLATGHYAGIAEHPETRLRRIKKGRDPDKDQSYFLYRLNQKQLSSVVFPIGGLTKTEVRKQAHHRGLPAADRDESQEICFIPGNDYVQLLRRQIPGAFVPGSIVDENGREIGRHPGILHYTIGQRRGLGIAAVHPLYVLEIRPEDNTVVVGENSSLLRKVLTAGDLHLTFSAAEGDCFEAGARIRYRHQESPASVCIEAGNRASVTFPSPVRAVTPGQSVVFYQGDEVLGGGIIQSR
ncbi:MAG: tRNA 2-thiouridine(34) synthase MnmA [Candidatus Aminicenantes bacterium]|nr:tRNA 2-thiouridine(34) synthase MnmA [Candidatus Aminicenantes bacterium]